MYFNLIRKCQTVFCHCPFTLPTAMHFLVAPHCHEDRVSSVILVQTISVRVSWYFTVVLISISPMTNMVEQGFMCLLPSFHLLLWGAFSSLLCKKNFFFFFGLCLYYWVAVLHAFWIKIFCQIRVLQIISPRLRFAFLFLYWRLQENNFFFLVLKKKIQSEDI